MAERSRYNKFGHPGKYIGVKTWTGGELNVSGSGDFVGAILVLGTAGAYTATDKITFTDGSELNIQSLARENANAPGKFLELSVASISGSSVSAADAVHLFTRNRLIY